MLDHIHTTSLPCHLQRKSIWLNVTLQNCPVTLFLLGKMKEATVNMAIRISASSSEGYDCHYKTAFVMYFC